MKILVVHPSVELYGADKILLYVLGFLAEGNEVTVLLPKNGVLADCIRESLPSVSLVISKDIPIVHSKMGIAGCMKLPRLLRNARKLFSHYDFDCVYCNTLATVLFLYSQRAKIKIIHVHEIIGNRILNFGFSALIRLRTKNVICVSAHVKERLFFSGSYSVVHNGIPDLFRTAERRGTPSRTMRFSFPGRYMPKKGQWFLIDALKCVPNELLCNAEFYLYGSPPPASPELEEQLKKAISTAGLERTVFLRGFQQDIAEVYVNSDVVLVPSMMSDPFPTTVLETMMFSKPVITTDNGGASEIVKDSFGILISPGDVEAFEKAIIYFLENKDVAITMGAVARKEYESKLTLDTFRKNFLNAVDYFLKGQNPHVELKHRSVK